MSTIKPTVTDEMIEKAAKAMTDDWNPDRDPILSAMFRDYAATAIAAVIDQIKADVLDERAVLALHPALYPSDATDTGGML